MRELELIGRRRVVVDLGAIDPRGSSFDFAAAVADQADVRGPLVVAHSGSRLLLGAICAAVDARRQVFLAVVPLDTARQTAVVAPGDDRTVRPEWMRPTALERLGVTEVEIDGGRCPHVANPALVAAILDGTASS